MALKKLIAPKANLTEEAIENIVCEYIRYDTDEKEIAFTPAGTTLPNKAKILVYLVGLQGWQFVVDEAITDSAKPSELEDVLGIAGGSLRPTLKDLKDRHLLMCKSGRYSVRAANLSAINAEVQSPQGSAAVPLKRARRKKSGTRSETSSEQANPNAPTKGGRKSTTSKARDVGIQFEEWIEQGYFDKPQTAADVLRRFHEEGTIIPRSSVPQYLLKSVRDHRLTRQKVDVDGKLVYVYRTKKAH